jgi:hypothetical protein
MSAIPPRSKEFFAIIRATTSRDGYLEKVAQRW